MNFVCTKCNKKFNQKVHLLTHLNRKNPCVENENAHNGIFVCSTCNKVFGTKGNLKMHLNKKTQCVPPINTGQYEYNDSDSENDNNSNPDSKNDDSNITTNDIENNKELQKAIKILKNNDLHKIIDLLQNNNIKTALSNSDNNNINSNNNTQNTINNTNNTYLLQYVSSNYPNAKNIEDCISIKNITPKLLQDCYDMYFLEGTMHIIKEMCNIGEEHRPFHCTDASRGNYIYKSNDVWRIDVGGEQIKSHIIPVIDDTYKQVHNNRVTNNPSSDRAKASMLLEMTSDNVKKVCGKALRKTTGLFIAKNSKNGKYVKDQKRILIA
jgi:Zinc finger, C2H2 type